MKIAIHQPNFAPWMGYFKKMADADLFVYYDDAQFTKSSFINRSNICKRDVTVPVTYTFGNEIYRVVLAENAEHVMTKLLKTLKQNGMRNSASMIDLCYFRMKPTTIAELNVWLNQTIKKHLHITTATTVSSLAGNPENKGVNRLIEIIKTLGGKEYLSGTGILKYADPQVFKDHGIKLTVDDYRKKACPTSIFNTIR